MRLPGRYICFIILTLLSASAIAQNRVTQESTTTLTITIPEKRGHQPNDLRADAGGLQ